MNLHRLRDYRGVGPKQHSIMIFLACRFITNSIRVKEEWISYLGNVKLGHITLS